MKALFFSKKSIKSVALVCLFTLSYQLLFPLTALALTSGPSQPEMQSFEPVGTTDMVNMFSGDFNYNIPLLDVGGYPINISYHGGVTIEQEASWVGLGWNINPGNINHVVRGVSDDFSGDEIVKKLKIEDEKTSTFGMLFGAEFSGWDTKGLTDKAKEAMKGLKNVSGSAQMNVGLTFNNYTGISSSVGLEHGASLGKGANPATGDAPWASGGINMGSTISTDNGVDIDYSLTFSAHTSKELSKEMNGNGGAGISFGGGMNSRAGTKYNFLGVNASVSPNDLGIIKPSGGLNNTYIPTGLQTYIPVITNATTVSSSFFQLKVGGEVYMFYPFAGASYAENTVHVIDGGSRKAYGYFNMDKATDDDIVDFTRDRDGNINRKTKYLPMSSMTYDIYAVNGQGTGGSFRPYRNDYGTVYDPSVSSNARTQSHLGELGFGNTFEGGYDLKTSATNSSSGPWRKHYKKFDGKENAASKFYEPYYLKQAGEHTSNNELLYDKLEKKKTLSYEEASDIIADKNVLGSYSDKRVTRANLLTQLTAEEASQEQVSLLPKIENYTSSGFASASDWNPTLINRIGGYRKAHHVSEMTQLLPNGQRYVYGLPVMNNKQVDFEVSTAATTDEFTDIKSGIILDEASKSHNNPNGVNEFYSRTETPSYAYSYMLTSVLSPDYVDITGNGITDDDLGSYTKFNYRKMGDYDWRIPYHAGTGKINPGLKSSCKDDRAMISSGNKEVWLPHSIESKDFIAEFHVSERQDSKGAVDPALSSGGAATQMYKLDKIVLYNKAERKAKGGNATPLKTVIFYYDYSLCQGIPNTFNSGSTNQGKLTLKSIFIKEGDSKIGYLSPYQFKYSSENPSYNTGAKDCWGNYKPVTSNNIMGTSSTGNLNVSNSRYPYVNQNDDNLDDYSSSWNLEEIILPSGGSIKVTYEADDYAYVQDKEVMEMFKVAGTGPSAEYIENNTLYNSAQDPYLYIYFKRRISEEHGASIAATYLNGVDVLQYTFDVNISNAKANSCSNSPLTEAVKGYGKIMESGVCTNNSNYAFVKLSPKTPNTLVSLKSMGVPGARLNPISVAAINFARYNNPKALRPESDITSVNATDIMNSLMSSFGEHINFFQSPFKTFINKGKAKNYQLDKSYIRLVSPGLKKKGGGHRVKRLEFFDTWAGSADVASYGSDYTYTTEDENTGATISSGVASYEPLFGGDENPWRVLVNTQEVGNKSKFPMADPIELMQEAPFGESMMPVASVGYSKVTVSSIHKEEGASSQSIQKHEFYTAKDFPVKIYPAGALKTIEDRKPGFFDIKHKKEIYRLSQGFAIELNDMHGKMKQQSTWVPKYVPTNPNTPTDNIELVSYTKYNYFTNDDKTIKNHDIPCVDFTYSNEPDIVYKTLGEEVEVTFDTREKRQKTDFYNFQFSVNCFIAPPLPITIPIGFPMFKKDTKIFSSFVSTKVIQKYGLIESVETYDKGAIIKAENTAFDPNTGQPIITTINTEHSDKEHSIKYPAYWAYKNMGMAYENIGIEENINGSIVKDDIGYLRVVNTDDYNIGDEIEVEFTDVCRGTDGKKYKVWVIDKRVPPETIPYDCNNTCATATNTLKFRKKSDNTCHTAWDVKHEIYKLTGDPEVYKISDAIEKVTIVKYPKPSSSTILNDFTGGIPHCEKSCTVLIPEVTFGEVEEYTAELHPNFSGPIVPYQTRYYDNLEMTIRDEISQKTSHSNGNFHVKGTRGDIYKISVKTATNSSAPPSSSTCLLYQTSPARAHGEDKTSLINSGKIGYSCAYSQFYNWPGCNVFVDKLYEYITTTTAVSNEERAVVMPPVMLVVKPYKKGAPAINDNNVAWPTDEEIQKGSIKVVRSGKRNMLTETVQDVTVTDVKGTIAVPARFGEPTTSFNQYAKTWNSTISASAKVFTDKAMVPTGISADYYNPFVTGEKGNYRVASVYTPQVQRINTSAGTSPAVISDRFKGLFGIESLWEFQNASHKDEFYNKMRPNFYANKWKLGANYSYSTWGRQVQVMDALFNRSIMLYDFDNRVPTATLSNCGLGMALYENFEDIEDLHSYQLSPLKYNYNPVKQWLNDNLPSGTLVGASAKLLVDEERHSGKNALEFTQGVSINIPIGAPVSNIQLVSFSFFSNQKYVVSCWQKVSTNGTMPPITSNVTINYGGITASLTPKTPPIDGWVLYEGEVQIPTPYEGQNASIQATAGTIIDDLRIFPSESNMKSYVYDRVHRRVAAALDENHMATFFEYNEEGKLTRVKRETEKGILTIKESRESLKQLISSYPY